MSRAVQAGVAPPGMFEQLGVSPARGTPFLALHHEAGGRAAGTRFSGPDLGAPAVLLSHEAWKTILGGSLNAVGSHLVLDGRRTEVIGVMPPDFVSPNPGDELWLPARRVSPVPGATRYAMTVGRLRAGVLPEQAALEATAALRRAGLRGEGERIAVTRVAEMHTRNIRPILDLLMVGAVLLVLMAGISVATLRASRATAERASTSIRRMLGATWLDEMGVIALRILALGLAVWLGCALLSRWFLTVSATWGVDLLSHADPASARGPGWVGAAVAVTAVLLSEIGPALDSAVRDRWGARLNSGGRSTTLKPALVAGLMAATALLGVTSLLGASAWMRLSGRDTYDDRRLARLSVRITGASDDGLPHHREVELLERLADAIRMRRDVESVAYADSLPDEQAGMVVFTGGGPGQRPDPGSGTAVRGVGPGFLEVLRIPVLEGRGFVTTDERDAVTVLDRGFAREVASRPVVGASVLVGSAMARVVGIVSETRLFPAGETVPTAYVPYSASLPLRGPPRAEVVVRFRAPPTEEQIAALGRIPGSAGPEFATLRVGSVRDWRLGRLGAPLVASVALGLFAAAGVLLSIGGIIGNILGFVSQQKRSIAVRSALGAHPDELVWFAARGALVSGTAGIAAGSLAGFVLSRFIASRVSWAETGEPWIWIGPTALMLFLLLAASAGAGLGARRVPIWPTLKSL